MTTLYQPLEAQLACKNLGIVQIIISTLITCLQTTSDERK